MLRFMSYAEVMESTDHIIYFGNTDCFPDLRDPSVTPLNFTRSINLALSERGINSMRDANRRGLLESILKETIPMHGRMIHGRKNGHLFEESQQYDIHGRYIRAVDRGELNKRLLDELENMPNVKFFFNHKLAGADFRKNLAWFEHRDAKLVGDVKGKPNISEVEVPFDFMIGADGAHSAVRYHLMKFARMNYQQDYIDTLWCEFHIEPKETPQGSEFRLSPNHLHIWPGGSFMFIAIPSSDKSFTSTLFMPSAKFTELDQNPDAVKAFFIENFPGVIPDLISSEDIVKQYTSNPHLPLISIKCSPYHYSSSVVILGDAAHAMVPFYGQGMNAGLESVRVLFEELDKQNISPTAPKPDRASQRAVALAAYTETRHPDARAICDLAYANYAEMSSHVQSPLYLLRKSVEEHLNAWFPSLGWATQYSRVSFGNERYSKVQASAKEQQQILTRVGAAVLGVSVGGAVFFAVTLRNKLGSSLWDRFSWS
jgi:kynurenine 3-monooxygenase